MSAKYNHKHRIPAAILTIILAAFTAPAMAADWNNSYIGMKFGYGELENGLSHDNGLIGFQLGRDWEASNWVGGIAIDANHLNFACDCGDPDTLTRIRLRGGYAFGNTLAYATAGPAYVWGGDVNDRWGSSIGAGLEHRLSDGVSIFGEITQERFDNSDGEFDLETTTATFGVNYRF
ncbi:MULTISPECIES: outer membrane protein [unclassified Ruegeria]|uniref:outer membrane protein n=1 Tax=unclassified Ruegeria TaxID=2625375 RepID=UPI00148911FF|nr:MULTISPECIES: outer membrane beta-barrel protein [unclassified Ruegeria]